MAVLERLKFLHQLPLLLKGTSDDDTPCPGYLYEEIAKISYESPGSCRCLMEHLLNRLQSSSCYVKLKVLKILLSLCSHGSPQFVQDLRRNASFIQEATDVSGPVDVYHGHSLYQKVRAAAQDLVGCLFSDTSSHAGPAVLSKARTQTGMGSQASHPQAMQGFGYSQDGNSMGTSGETFLNGIQRAAVAVTHAVLPGSVPRSSCPSTQSDDTYTPVAVPSSDRRPPSEKPLPVVAHNCRVSHRSGVPGGGWDESDSGHSSQESEQYKFPHSRSSDANSKSGSDGQSRSSNRESAEMTDRVESSHPGDCLQEAQLVWTVTRGRRVFLTKEEVQHFVRGCSLLNCEVVFEMLNRSLMDENSCIRMRSMCAISALMTSDLLSHDHMLAVVRINLQKLSKGSPGPVTDKATKILRQFEALIQNSPERRLPPQETAPCTVPTTAIDLLNELPPLSQEGGILTPVSLPSSPTLGLDAQYSVNCCSVVNEAESEQGWDLGMPTKEPPEQSERPRCGSLFDGMELVCLVQSRAQRNIIERPATEPTPTVTATEDTEGLPKSGLPSVFSFLNS
ncbi:AP-4 complex accessory subunit tepsin [Discoglossus pictus]